MTEGAFKAWFFQSRSLRNFFLYKQSEYCIHDIDRLRLNAALALKLVTRGPVTVVDSRGRRKNLSWLFLVRLAIRYGRGLLVKKATLRRIMEMMPPPITANEPRALRQGRAVYIRSDLIFGLQGGGSVGHIAGVLNNLESVTGEKPLFLGSDRIPTVHDDIATHIIGPASDFTDDPEFDTIFYNRRFLDEYKPVIADDPVSFLYQRYSLNNFCGARMARDMRIPFVLEYNGSEIWVSKNWGRSLRYESVSERIELLNLHRADLIVVVSAPMKDELMARGISAEKILVNPNGVNPEMYRPDIDGTAVSDRYDLRGKTVIGFIGTFGKWHGADILAHAYRRIVKDRPDAAARLSLMMIGDGPMMADVRTILDGAPGVVLPGTIPQSQGPCYLAACDILVASHRPNDDGTPFFGSPTKLFEYMAMGKGIVASDLDQIGHILEHERTALMLKPGDVDDLCAAILRLADDADLRRALGDGARRDVVSKFTWEMHTQKIYDRLKEIAR